MPSLERFVNPQTRVFSLNLTSLPGARLYFFFAGSTTPKTTYADKEGGIPNSNPVIADSSGVFPPIFLDGLYRVELRSAQNIVQPGWPIDNVGQDRTVVPFGEWNETFTYSQFFPVTGSDGNWYRSINSGNLGNDPVTNPDDWELVPVPVASSFTSNVDWISFSDDGDQISLDVDIEGMADAVEDFIDEIGGDLNVLGTITAEDVISPHFGEALRKNPISYVSNSTLAKDTDLTINGLLTGWYFVSGIVVWNPNGGGASNGIKITLDNDSSTALQKVTWVQATTASSSPESSTLSAPSFFHTSGDAHITFSGMVRLDSGESLSIWTSQANSSATQTSILYGSLTVRRVGEGV